MGCVKSFVMIVLILLGAHAIRLSLSIFGLLFGNPFNIKQRSLRCISTPWPSCPSVMKFCATRKLMHIFTNQAPAQGYCFSSILYCHFKIATKYYIGKRLSNRPSECLLLMRKWEMDRPSKYKSVNYSTGPTAVLLQRGTNNQ